MRDTLLTTKQTAKMLGLSPVTLRKQRCSGTGEDSVPLVPFLKMGRKCVRYRLSSIRKFIDHIEAQSTSAKAEV